MVQSPAKKPIFIIRAPARWPGLGLGELWRTRRVLLVLAQRQFKALHQSMVLGIVWVLLEPLIMTLVTTVLLTWIMGEGSDRYGLPLPVFLLTAWTAWRVFGRVVNQGGSAIRANAPLVERIYLPRVHLIVAVALVSLVDLVFLVVALLAVLVLYGIAPGVGLLALPLLLAIMYAFALGIAFLASAASMGIPDVEFVRQLFMRTWFWLSPVIYPSSVVPEPLREVYYLNPMVVVIDGFRWAFAQAPAPSLASWVLGASVACVVLAAGYVYFRRREPYFADLL